VAEVNEAVKRIDTALGRVAQMAADIEQDVAEVERLVGGTHMEAVAAAAEEMRGRAELLKRKLPAFADAARDLARGM